jgi:SH3-like domain-containing protein
MLGINPKSVALLAVTVILSLGLAGCSHFRVKPADAYVYVTAKEDTLRDRVAPVSNRTGTVSNGEKLVVLERARRFVKVRTPRGEVGWIKEKNVADQGLADQFEALRLKHLSDRAITSAATRDEVYMHIAPGLKTDRFFLLAEGDKLSLLGRATIAKPVTPGAATPATRPAGNGRAGKAGAGKDAAVDQPEGPPAPVMEDWWLVRDAKGDTGWLYSHLIDVDAPDTLVRYAEGQRIIGAYVLTMVDDPESGILNNGQTVTSIPEYLTLLSPYKAGLPYDFNQVRVFIWNTKKHRYETAFREHNIAGYLPVVVGANIDPYGHAPNSAIQLPAFSYRVLAGDASIPTPDPVTGIYSPAKTIEKTYRLEGNICRRILIAPGTEPPAEAHPEPEPEKKAKEAKKRRR